MSSNQHEQSQVKGEGGHSKSTTRSAAERNRAHFSSPDALFLSEKEHIEAYAARWTDEFIAEQSWFNLSSLVDPSGSSLKLLDYACGPGMLSFAAMKLEPAESDTSPPLFSQITGVDVADGMVKLFNERVASSDISPNISIRAYRGDLVSASAKDTQTPATETNAMIPELDASKSEFFSYNFIASILSLHHFEDPQLALVRLTERLAPGGLLFICDRIPGSLEDAEDVWEGRKEAPPEVHNHGHGSSNGNSHSHGHEHGASHATEDAHTHHHDHGHGQGHGHGHKPDFGVTFPGFTKHGTEEMFTAAGLSEMKTRLMDLPLEMPPSMGGSKGKVFWVVGKKAEN